MAGKAPARVVHDDTHVRAILDVNPISPGHTLVLTKQHIPLFTDMEPAQWANQAGPLFKTAYAIARKMKNGLGCDHVSMLVRGMRVPHIHIHLIPSYKGQQNLLDVTLMQVDFVQPRLKPELDDAALDDIAEKIKKAKV